MHFYVSIIFSDLPALTVLSQHGAFIKNVQLYKPNVKASLLALNNLPPPKKKIGVSPNPKFAEKVLP